MSHETIYQNIYWDQSYVGVLQAHLLYKMQRRKRYGSFDRLGKLINQVSIEERVAVVVERFRGGDWELDTIIGTNHKLAIHSVNQRAHSLIRYTRMKTKDAESVTQARSLVL